MKISDLIKAFLLPLSLINDIIKSQRSLAKKIGYLILVLVIFGVIWLGALKSSIDFARAGLFELGITDKVTKVKISGTSMLPTLKDGSEVELKSPRKYGIERGDIVTFKNVETGSYSYIKRVIGLENENISIKNGYYFIDGKPLEEAYILNNLPTFGNTFLADCEVVKVPKGYYFVSGDNRTVSSDSRVLGFVNSKDIDGVIKTQVEQKFPSQVRQKQIANASIDSKTFINELNARITKEKSSPLVTNDFLNQIAESRADQIVTEFNNWKQDSVPLDELLDSKGYKFNAVHEFITFGYLSEKDIINQIFELQSEKDKFVKGNFTEVGIGIQERSYKECKYPVISVILSWPAVPTYSQADIDSWASEITTTTTIMSNMQTWIGVAGVDSSKIRQLINLASMQNQIATRLYNKMKNREWLSPKDYQDIQNYDKSVDEYNKIYEDVFGKVKGVTTNRDPKKNL